MEDRTSFGYWLRRRRKALDLTQEELARLVGCALGTIKRIEADDRRPSKQLAARLADYLQLSENERVDFVRAARMPLGTHQLLSPGTSSVPVLPGLAATDDSASVTSHQLGQATTPDGLASRSSASRDQRRLATVLFADISDFTSFAEHMDIEEVKALSSRWIEHMSEQVRRFGGTIVNVMGDGVLAVFGAPLAHEDDAVRAVRAAIALRDGPRLEEANASLQLHIGINTGEVLATVHGPPEHRHYTVLGDAVNTANRILKSAARGTILVGEETYRATRQTIQYRELAPIEAKGKERPVRIWQVLSGTLIPAGRVLGTAPLIGRDDELGLLRSLWARAVREQQPHLVTIIGEPGIGKSRLSAEFVAGLGSEARVLHGRCLPYGTTLSYWPLAMMLRDAADIVADDESEAARAKLTALVERVIDRQQGRAEEVARHLALLSGLDTEADREVIAGDQKMLHASARLFFEAFAHLAPLCLIFEDIHWGDAALLDLIEQLAARIREAPLFILVQARPELIERRGAWGRNVTGLTTILLGPLSEHAERALVVALCQERELPELTAHRIGHGPNGNPLFAEEIVAMAAEHGQLTGVPTAIKALIAARVDSLPHSERDVLQVAAVFGKAFWESGLHALAGGMIENVADDLDALEMKNLIRYQTRSQFPGDRECVFKHDLIRDVIYEMLPRTERRFLHNRVVGWMEQIAGEHIDQYLDQLAHHALHAGHREQAIDFLSRAAERAIHAADYRQAAVLLQQAIMLAEELGLQGLVAEFHARRGKALVTISMWADARLELEMALAGLPPDQQSRRALVFIDLATVCFWVHDIPELRRSALEAMNLAQQLNRDDIAAGALAALALVHSSQGEPQLVESVVAQSLQRAGHHPIAAVTFGVAIQSFNFYWLGRFDAAQASAQHAVEIARGMKDTQFISYSLPHAGLALAARGAYAEAEQVFCEAQQYCRDYEIWPNLARAIAISAGYHLDVFDYSGHEVIAEEARELARSANLLNPLVSASLDLLFNYTRRGDVARAEGILADVAETVERAAGAHGWLWRLRLMEARAELALTRGEWEESMQLAERAIVECQKRGRVKYEAFGRETRAQALMAVGRHHEAVSEARSNVELVRPLGAPAQFLRAAALQLSLDGDDLLLNEARAAALQIAVALPNNELRQTFERAELVSKLSTPR